MIYKWKCQSLTASVNNQANVLATRTQNKCQETYYSNNSLFDAKLFGFACCNSHGKGRFSLCRYIVLMKKRIESWEPEGNVPLLLCDRFAKGEREKMMTVWNSATMYRVTNVESYQVTKDH